MNRNKSFLVELKVAINPPRGHVDHEGSTCDGEHGAPRVTEESVNIDKCAAIQARTMKQGEFKPQGHYSSAQLMVWRWDLSS